MSEAIYQINRMMRGIQKNKSTAQKQECLSVSDIAQQHEIKNKKYVNTTKI